jgi:ubiquinone/menaquinone biosynthesis C-methylase UbiE
MDVKRSIVAQFGNPRGWLGMLAGWIMARRNGNRLRNAMTVELLAPEAHHRVLEVGCGPGIALHHLTRHCTSGKVVGLDRSTVMLAQAGKRNARALTEGRLELRHGDLERADVEFPAGSFDRILAVNVAMFFEHERTALETLQRLLRPGGRLAITQQPRFKGATEADTREIGKHWAELLTALGFENVRLELLDVQPVPAACVIGEAPSTK